MIFVTKHNGMRYHLKEERYEIEHGAERYVKRLDTLYDPIFQILQEEQR